MSVTPPAAATSEPSPAGAASVPPAAGAVTASPAASQLDQDILDALGILMGQLLVQGEKLAERYAVPFFCVKALHWLDTSVPMKELGRRMRCDPSFVTSIADTLEKRGLAVREPSAADRRIKNLVLTADGIEVKRQIERELVAVTPWPRVLDVAERECLLALVRKMIKAAPPVPLTSVTSARARAPQLAPPQTGGGRAGEVSDALDTASTGRS